MKNYYVYIVTNKPQGTLYIGVTNDLYRRMVEHRQGLVYGFTKKYSLKKLVYFQTYSSIEDAISLEKRLKGWHRQWKINIIEEVNPEWNDLFELFGLDPEPRSG